MKLIPVQATDTTPKTIYLISDWGNKFASIDQCDNLRIFGEDMTITVKEAKIMLDISDNFELYFNNIKTQ